MGWRGLADSDYEKVLEAHAKRSDLLARSVARFLWPLFALQSLSMAALVVSWRLGLLIGPAVIAAVIVSLVAILVGTVVLTRWCRFDLNPMVFVPVALIPVGGLICVWVFVAWPLLQGTFGSGFPNLSGPLGIPIGWTFLLWGVAWQVAILAHASG